MSSRNQKLKYTPAYYGNRFGIAGPDGRLVSEDGRVRTWDTLEEVYRATADMCGVSFERFLALMEPIVGRQSFDPRPVVSPEAIR